MLNSGLIFITPTHVYDSYHDMRLLIDNGWGRTIAIKDIEWEKSDADYIWYVCRNDEFWQLVTMMKEKKHRFRLWLYDLERPNRPDQGPIADQYFEVGELYRHGVISGVIVSDRWYQRHWQQAWYLLDETNPESGVAPHIPTIYCPIAGMPGMYTLRPCDSDIIRKPSSFVHMSYVWGRRGVLNKLPGCLPNCWGEKRHETLLQTSFGINIHQDDYPQHEPLRFMLFASYGVPILTEHCADYGLFLPGVDCMELSYKRLAEDWEMFKQRYDEWDMKGMAKNALIRCTEETDFSQQVRQLESALAQEGSAQAGGGSKESDHGRPAQ